MKKNWFSFFMLALCWLGLVACESKANAVTTGGTPQKEKEEVTVTTEESAVTEAGGEVVELTPAQFDKMVAHYKDNPRRYVGYRPCIVDFYATWCGPCKKLAPIMEKLAKKYKGKVSFYKVDVDKAEELSGTYGIQSIPTVFFCANGEIRSQVGLMPETALEEIIEEMLIAPLK